MLPKSLSLCQKKGFSIRISEITKQVKKAFTDWAHFFMSPDFTLLIARVRHTPSNS